MAKRVRIILAAVLVLGLALAAGACWAADPLPSWRGPIKAQLLEYVQAVSAPGSKDFIPEAQRIAAFDMDGTVICERPMPFVVETAQVWLHEHCAQFSKQGPAQAELCRAAALGLQKIWRKHISALVSLPFMGMGLERFRELSLEVFETHVNPLLNRPLKELVYLPQLELIDFLHHRGFQVWLCSGSSMVPMQAISAKYLHVSPQRCIGTRFYYQVEEVNGALVFERQKPVPGLLNLEQVKAVNLKLATVHGPVLAFGNSYGDEWILKYAAASPRRSLVLVLDHDDPREVIYQKPWLLKLARERGWSVVSMKDSWTRVFD